MAWRGVAWHIKYMVPGVALLIVFALIIPGFWFLILWYNRNKLDVSGSAAKRSPVPGFQRRARAPGLGIRQP